MIDPWKGPNEERHSPRDFMPYGHRRRVNPPPAVATLSMRRDDSELPPAPAIPSSHPPSDRNTTPPTSPFRQEGQDNWASFPGNSPVNRQGSIGSVSQGDNGGVEDDQDFSLEFSHAHGYQAATSVEPVDTSARTNFV